MRDAKLGRFWDEARAIRAERRRPGGAAGDAGAGPAVSKDDLREMMETALQKGGAARDPSGTLTAGGLYEFLPPKVQDAASLQNRDQTPVLEGAPRLVISGPRYLFA